MTTRYLPGVYEYFLDKSNHRYINDVVIAGLDLRYSSLCAVVISHVAKDTHEFILVRMCVGDDEYDLLGINAGDVLTTISLTEPFFDKYCSIFKRILRLHTLDEILKDLAVMELETHQ